MFTIFTMLFGQAIDLPGSQIIYSIKFVDFTTSQFGAEYGIVLPSNSTSSSDKAIALSMQFKSDQTSLVKIWLPFAVFVSQNKWYDARLSIDQFNNSAGQLTTLFRFIGTNPSIKPGIAEADLLKLIVPDSTTGFVVRFLPSIESDNQKQIAIQSIIAPTSLPNIPPQATADFLKSTGMYDVSTSNTDSEMPLNTKIMIASGIGVGFITLCVIILVCRKRKSANVDSTFKNNVSYNNNHTNKMDQMRETQASLERPVTEWSEYDEKHIADATNTNTVFTDYTENGTNTVYTEFTEFNSNRPSTQWSEVDEDIKDLKFESGDMQSLYSATTRYSGKPVDTMYTQDNPETMYTEGSQTIYTEVEPLSEYTDNKTMFTEDSANLNTVYTEETHRTGLDTMFTDDDQYTVDNSTIYTQNIETMYSDISSLRESEYGNSEYSELRDSKISLDY
eukprot:NODE_88_length_21932_cov_0.317867.p3 type:complete len:448 gc:universal NODE_88_length_21932_cov_0.317867:6073-4730(-)